MNGYERQSIELLPIYLSPSSFIPSTLEEVNGLVHKTLPSKNEPGMI